ncbi:MAG: hypothetical protein HOK21_25445 [Rhodospirillaceae bacterium]|nr:hypothetical protein [Rhodospirillaceae bacterium]MBT4044829.1 hypothetical protein [Rhodospirillaceae bacterium]MBT4690074.1 hypothetical protein [Rhodospirillaceae bacterium]MBT5079191.1 hypothetical protein [Rhodospirillaceae bacterium]MBT5527443.1 hypothetical protein [Rhodospirillaceae bacterium]
MQQIEGHDTGISSVAVSPDGKAVLTGSWDKNARLWPNLPLFVEAVARASKIVGHLQPLSAAECAGFGIADPIACRAD